MKDDSVSRSNSLRIALYNWLYGVGVAIVAAAIVGILIYIFPGTVNFLLNLPIWVAGAGVISLLAVVIAHGKGRWFAFFGLKHFDAMPPLWVVGFLGVSLVFGLFGILPYHLMGILKTDAAPNDFIIISLIFGSASIFLFICSRVLAIWRLMRNGSALKAKGNKTTPPTISVPTIPDVHSFSELENWLREENEGVREESYDRFDHAIIARRLTRRIIENLGDPPAQAVVGRLGAGKTTIMHFMREEIIKSSQRKNVHLIPVGLWPYETTHAAVAGVIRSILDELSREVNILGLKGIPDSYIQAMSAQGGFWGVLSQLVRGVPKEPIDTLKSISLILSGIDHHFIIWIEDLERFVGTHKEYSEGERDHETERLNPIRSLLYSLNTLPNLTVITAATSLHKRFDLEKIARYVEQIPTLSQRYVEPIIRIFRTGCLEGEHFIDTTKPSERERLVKFASSDRMQLARILGFGYSDISLALLSLCTTPRTLKQGLRRCLDFWEQFRGEIDFDDLLLMSLLRESEPDLFSLIGEHIDGLRISPHGDGRAEANKAFEEALGQTKLYSLTRENVKEIIKFIFDVSQADKPQGVAQYHHVDYWQLFLTEPEIEESKRDQNLLQIVTSDSDEKLLEAFRDDERVEGVEYFDAMIPPERTKGLLVPLMSLYSQDDPVVWGEEPPAGFISLWRNLLEHKKSGRLTVAELLDQIKIAIGIIIPKNLELASHFKYYFIDAFEREKGGILSDPDIKYYTEAGQHLQKTLCDAYEGKPDALASSCAGANPWALFQLCYGIDRKRSGEVEDIPFGDWSRIAGTVLEAGHAHPQEMAPQIAGLVVSGSSSISWKGRQDNYQFNSEVAVRLFGDSEKVRSLFAGINASEWRDKRVQAMIRAVQDGSA